MKQSVEVPPITPSRGYESAANTKQGPRYEEITQDGRVQLAALLPGMTAVWRALGTSKAMDVFRARGILPILRRIVIVGEEGPFSVHSPIEISGTWRLAREAGGERLFLNMWIEARAPIGSTHAPQPGPDAERVLVGRAYAEHVITRPFADTPAERKVTRLDAPGLPELPEDEQPFEDAERLVDGVTLDHATEHTFGMLHTDSNQHVNSLVYPRLFEEAAVTHAMATSLVPAAHGLLCRAVDIRYRKPFFAGEHARLALRVDRADAPAPGRRAATAGAFLPLSPTTAAAPAKPSTTVAMLLG